MFSKGQGQTMRRRTPSMLLVVVVTAVFNGVLGCSSSLVGPSSSETSAKPTVAHPATPPRHDRPGSRDEIDDTVPDGTTVFDGKVPAVANLDPKLRRALRRAATSAAGDGVEFYVNSGWRSRKHQERLFRQAISTYGSRKAAARWVAVPGTSVHEKGKAVDLGQSDARWWLRTHGASYGLCQVYRNEPWHYELRPDAVDQGCPPQYADPTQDRRRRR